MNKAVIYISGTTNETVNNMIVEVLERYCEKHEYEIVALLGENSQLGMSMPMKYSFIGMAEVEDIDAVVTLSSAMVGTTDKEVMETIELLAHFGITVETANGYDSMFEYYQKIGVKRCYDRDIGEHMWSASTVMETLYNEVYIGSVINNKTADNIDTGHQVVQRDKEDWIIVENCHEPLVSVEDFKLAHKMIARREVTKRKPNGKWRKSYIRCGVCGKGLYKYGNKSSYRCHNGHVSRIRGEALESALLDIARNMALAQLQEFELKTDGGNCPDNFEREIESLKKSKAHYAKLKFEIYDDYTKANITREQMAKKTAEVKQKIAEIESLITEKQETLDMQKDLFLDAKQEQLTKLSKLDEFDEEVIRYLIDYVLVYDNEHIEIRWNFDDFQAG